MSPPPRQTFQEAMELVSLPSPDQTKRYASVRAAWIPGSDIPRIQELIGPGKVLPVLPTTAFGGHVFSQAGLAVSRAVEDFENSRGIGASRRLGIHVGETSGWTTGGRWRARRGGRREGVGDERRR